MKLEYLNDISDDGKYSNVVSDNLVRLYDFDDSENKMFVLVIQNFFTEKKQTLSLASVDFIQCVNCELSLIIFPSDKGIKKEVAGKFICALTVTGCENLIERMKFVAGGHNWLCDTSEEENIDFILSRCDPVKQAFTKKA